jgi:hypothetical protein
MIVKMQLALMPQDAPILVYDQYKRVHHTLPQTPTLRKMFAGRMKIYAEATMNRDGTLTIGRVVPDRGW